MLCVSRRVEMRKSFHTCSLSGISAKMTPLQLLQGQTWGIWLTNILHVRLFWKGETAVGNTQGNCGQHRYLEMNTVFFSSFSIPFLLLPFFFHIVFIAKPVSYRQGSLFNHPNLISPLICGKKALKAFNMQCALSQ